MTAIEAYETDDTFRALVDEWVSERRCPRPLVDRCLELGMDGAADCCRWASDSVRTPDLRVHNSRGPDERPGPCGPYPTQDNGVAVRCPTWFWTQTANGGRGPRGHAADVDRPFGYSGPRRLAESATPTASILALMDLWVPAARVDGPGRVYVPLGP